MWNRNVVNEDIMLLNLVVCEVNVGRFCIVKLYKNLVNISNFCIDSSTVLPTARIAVSSSVGSSEVYSMYNMDPRMAQLCLNSFSFTMDVIVFTETWLKPKVFDSEIFCIIIEKLFDFEKYKLSYIQFF